MRRLFIFIAVLLLLHTGAHGQLSRIVAGEYFFDSDPGFGAATALPAFTAGENVDVSFLAVSSGLSRGMHTLGIRVRDDNNRWSMPQYTTVYLMANDPVTLENISGAEYFFDTDPGVGNGVAIPVGTAAPIVDVSFAAATASLPMGMHVFAIRVRNANGEWGLPNFTPLYVDRSRTISKIEYAFDSDPGPGAGTQIPVTPPTDVLDQTFNLPTSVLAPGPHSLIVRVAGQNDFWSISDTVDFVVCATATPAGAADVVCSGSATNFTDNSITIAGDQYAWDFDGDGAVDATTSGNQTFTYPGAGTYNATLTIDRSGCIATVDIPVTVDGPATVNAGPDQSICGNASATLNANASGASSIAWTTSGDGSFTDAGILNPSYTPGANDLAAGSVVLTVTVDDAGACAAQSDNATIAFTKAINVVTRTVNATIGDAEDVSLEAGGTFNSGDVLAATIIGNAAKGVTQLKTGNVLEYVANTGTVGKDSVRVQLCNQCNQCDAEYIFFTIVNEPPVANIPATQTTSGSQVVINVTASVSDPNNNIDPSSISIVQQPVSGATATIDGSFNLILDYSAVSFAGTDQLTIQVCDDLDVCIQQIVSIDVQALPTEVMVYNAVAPNSTGDNRFMRILNLPQGNKVTVYNRWGDKVFEIENYDSDVQGKRFEGMNQSGKPLPSGIYFYKIEITDQSGSDSSPLTGYLSLKM